VCVPAAFSGVTAPSSGVSRLTKSGGDATGSGAGHPTLYSLRMAVHQPAPVTAPFAGVSQAVTHIPFRAVSPPYDAVAKPRAVTLDSPGMAARDEHGGIRMCGAEVRPFVGVHRNFVLQTSLHSPSVLPLPLVSAPLLFHLLATVHTVIHFHSDIGGPPRRRGALRQSGTSDASEGRKKGPPGDVLESNTRPDLSGRGSIKLVQPGVHQNQGVVVRGPRMVPRSQGTAQARESFPNLVLENTGRDGTC
jgi:hypothetical protein